MPHIMQLHIMSIQPANKERDTHTTLWCDAMLYTLEDQFKQCYIQEEDEKEEELSPPCTNACACSSTNQNNQETHSNVKTSLTEANSY